LNEVGVGVLDNGVSFFFSQKEREDVQDVFQSFSKKENKEAVFLKTIDNSLLIITVKMPRENKLSLEYKCKK